MNRENLLFAIIGVLLGFIVGFMLASSMSTKMNAPAPTTMTGNGPMPADHPPLGAQGQRDPQQTREEVTAKLERAKNEPKNFEAQIEAARLHYQINRYDQSIEYLLKANELRPTDYETVVTLGLVNLDAKHYETAEKWYRAAIKMNGDDVRALAGLAEATLQKGDAKAGEQAIAQLEKVSPSNEDLPRFKNLLAGLKSK